MRRRRNELLTVALAGAVTLGAVAYVTWHRATSAPRSTGVAGGAAGVAGGGGASAVGTGRIGPGEARFRTERFERAKQAREGDASRTFGLRDVWDDEHTAELAFQLQNDSGQVVTITWMRMQLLGEVVVREDRATRRLERLFERAGRQDRIVTAWPLRTDLGRVVSTLGDGTLGDAVQTEDLLSDEHLEVLEPGSVRSFLVRLRVRTTSRASIIAAPSPIVEFSGEILRHPNALRPPEHTQPSVRGLATLGSAEPVDAMHLVGMKIGLLGSDGERIQLYSDWLYALRPSIALASIQIREKADGTLPLREVFGSPPADLLGRLAGQAIKTHREALAYTVAAEHEELPPGFDPDTISPYCFTGDPAAPYRPAAAPTTAATIEAIGTLASQTRVERSNLADVLAYVADEHPVVWSSMRRGLDPSPTDDALARKLGFLRQQLNRRGVL
jgi:hypothetical protein